MSWGPMLSYSVLALTLSWLVVFVFWKDYRDDLFRDRLDKLSAELFDFTAAACMPAGDPACRTLAALLEEASTCASRLNFARLMLCRMAWADRQEPLASWRRRLDEIGNADARAFLDDVHRRARLELARHMVALSPWLWVLLASRPAAPGGFHARLPGFDQLEILLPSFWASSGSSS